MDKIPLTPVVAATLVTKAIQLAKIIMVAIPVEAAKLAEVVQLAKAMLSAMLVGAAIIEAKLVLAVEVPLVDILVGAAKIVLAVKTI